MKLHSIRAILKLIDKERLVPSPTVILLYLDKQKRLLQQIHITKKDCSDINLTSKQLFTPALRNQAEFLVVIHIRPSGALKLSRALSEQTYTIEKIGSYLGVKLLDCLVVSARDYVSFRENGLMYPLKHLC